MRDVNKGHMKSQSHLESFSHKATDLQVYWGLLDNPKGTKVTQMQTAEELLRTLLGVLQPSHPANNWSDSELFTYSSEVLKSHSIVKQWILL